MPLPCDALQMGSMKSSSVPGRNVNVQEEPACRKRNAAIKRGLNVVLIKGLVNGA